MSNLLSISDVRANLPDLVTNVSKYMDRITITVNGQPKAILMSAEELDSLEETAKVRTMPHIIEDIEKSRQQIKKGQFIPLSKLE